MRTIALLALATLLLVAPTALADHHRLHFEGRLDFTILIEYCEWDIDAQRPADRHVYCQKEA